MELLPLVHALAILFTVLSALLITVILGVHFRENLRLRNEATFRHAAEPLVKKYLAGSTPLPEVAAALQQAPVAALTLFLDLSESATPRDIGLLRDMGKKLSYLQPMLQKLKHGNATDRLQNAQRLGYLRDQSAVPDLMQALEDEFPDVRLAAAQSLALLECPDAVKKILLKPHFAGEMPHERVVEVLVQFGTCALNPLMDVLQDPPASVETLAIAVQACGMLRAHEAVPLLEKSLQHKSPQIRSCAACALAALGEVKAIAPLARLAEDPDPRVRSDVMFALGILQASNQVPLVGHALNDANWKVRHSAAQALYQIGHAGRKALEEKASHPENSPARSISRQILQEHGQDWPVGEVLV